MSSPARSVASTDVLLLNVPPSSHDMRRAAPLGIAYLAASLRRSGRSCVLIDGTMQPRGTVPSALAAEILKHHPQIIGMSVITSAMPLAVNVARHLKNKRPGIPIVFGGIHPTIAHREVLRDYPEVDIVVRGEAEATLVELVEALSRHGELSTIDGVSWRRDGQVVANRPRRILQDLDALAFPARDLLPSPQEYGRAIAEESPIPDGSIPAAVISSRGCPMRCRFCSMGGDPMQRGHWRPRSAQNVVDEIVEIHHRYGANRICFADDNFFVIPERSLEIMRLSRKAVPGLMFVFATRADLIVRHAAAVAELPKLGCDLVEIGIESGSDTLLRRYQKDTNAATNAKALQILAQYGISPWPGYILFDYAMAFDDLVQNVRFLHDHLIGSYPPRFDSKLILYPGTELRSEALCGIENAPHDLPDPEFVDSAVARAYDYYREYCTSVEHRVHQTMWSLAPLQLALDSRIRSCHDRQTLRNLRQALRVTEIDILTLRRLPYRDLVKLIDAAGKQDGESRLASIFRESAGVLNGIESRLVAARDTLELKAGANGI